MKIKISDLVNGLGFDILSLLPKKGFEGENYFISPSSIQQVLLMIMNGADGSTLTRMADVLKVMPDFLREYGVAVSGLLEDSRDQSARVKFKVANALFVKEKYQLLDEFVQRNQQYFQATLRNLPFQSDPEGSRKVINDWASDNTDKMIPSIIDDKIPKDAVLYLLNAVCFDGQWTVAFDPKLTREDEFAAVGGRKKLRFMMRQARFQYAQTDDYQVVSLPYGDDGRYCMDVLLPRQDIEPLALIAQFVAEDRSWLDTPMPSKLGTVRLPQFKLECKYSLKETLEVMGMSVAFSRMTADFSKMVAPPERLHIDQVLHKTFLEVNEEGTRAAAVTAGGISRTTAVDPNRPFFMNIDHPFVCAIRDTRNNVLHFLGLINNPSK